MKPPKTPRAPATGRPRTRSRAATKPPHIHPSAIIAAGAEIEDDVQVGPYTIIGPRVRIGSGTTIGAHTVIEGNTTIGSNNAIFQFAALGAPPQDRKFGGEDSALVIGERNCIREFATLHPGTAGGGMITRVGNDNLLMAYTHVAHDCILGDHIVMANGAQLGGHTTLEDYIMVGAMVGVLQFSRIGESAMLGAGSMVSQDVAPFCNATGDRAVLHGLNLVGLRRRGFSDQVILALKKAYRLVFRSGLKVAEAIQQVRQAELGVPEVDRFLAFIEKSERGVCR